MGVIVNGSQPINHLGHNEDLEIHVLGEGHAARVNAEDAALGLDVRQRELDLTVNTTRPNEGRVKRLDVVGGHNDLDVTPLIEAIELVEEFEHGPLDLTRTALRGG